MFDLMIPTPTQHGPCRERIPLAACPQCDSISRYCSGVGQFFTFLSPMHAGSETLSMPFVKAGISRVTLLSRPSVLIIKTYHEIIWVIIFPSPLSVPLPPHHAPGLPSRRRETYRHLLSYSSHITSPLLLLFISRRQNKILKWVCHMSASTTTALQTLPPSCPSPEITRRKKKEHCSRFVTNVTTHP